MKRKFSKVVKEPFPQKVSRLRQYHEWIFPRIQRNFCSFTLGREKSGKLRNLSSKLE